MWQQPMAGPLQLRMAQHGLGSTCLAVRKGGDFHPRAEHQPPSSVAAGGGEQGKLRASTSPFPW